MTVLECSLVDMHILQQAIDALIEKRMEIVAGIEDRLTAEMAAEALPKFEAVREVLKD